MFRKAVSTVEGCVYTLVISVHTQVFPLSVKADFLFSYQPPVNLVALFIMLPASRLLSPRWFHKVKAALFLEHIMLIDCSRRLTLL